MSIDYKRVEWIVRGVSCHRRVQILDLLVREPGLSLKQISHRLRADFKVIAEHTRRLQLAGHLEKRQVGRDVKHVPTELGGQMLAFLRGVST